MDSYPPVCEPSQIPRLGGATRPAQGRGFYLCHSHLSQPERLSRLLMATCLAYYWLVCLGADVLRHGWQAVVHRAKRCDLSLFQLSLFQLSLFQLSLFQLGLPVPVRLQVQARK